MYWERDPPDFPQLPDDLLPSELLEGLERHSAGARLLKIRFRWRPHGARAVGYVTHNRILAIESASNLELTRALGSYARHLFDQGECEARFEAQLHRELTIPGGKQREWRSITFYAHPPDPEVAMQDDNHFDDDELDDHDDDDDDDDDELDDDDDDDDDDDAHDDDEQPVTQRRFEPRPSRPRTTPHTRPALDTSMFSEYAGYVELLRSEPVVFAMLISQKSHDRTVDTLERVLFASFDRLDRTLESQGSNHQFINHALETITHGAGEVASVGLDLFRSGLEHQAGATRINHDTEVGKERTELMRDAVKQGSLLIQAVLMSNTAKRRQSTERDTAAGARKPDAERAASHAEPTGGPTAAPEPDDPELTALDNRFIEGRTRQLLELLTPALVDELRPYAPTLAPVFDKLRSRPVTAAWVREVLGEAQETVDRDELDVLAQRLDPEIGRRLGALVMRVLSGTM